MHLHQKVQVSDTTASFHTHLIHKQTHCSWLPLYHSITTSQPGHLGHTNSQQKQLEDKQKERGQKLQAYLET
jgi:hypothetical protein